MIDITINRETIKCWKNKPIKIKIKDKDGILYDGKYYILEEF